MFSAQLERCLPRASRRSLPCYLTLALGAGAFLGSVASAQSAIDSLNGLSSNSGLYSNRIVVGAPPLAYTEVCFKAGALLTDQHAGGESTAGGNCLPGDLGWVIEHQERAAAGWETARAECLMSGMRLPEPFEFKYSCINAGDFGLSDMTGGFEWASNSAAPQFSDGRSGIASVILGGTGCADGTLGWVGDSNEFESVGPYRCVR